MEKREMITAEWCPDPFDHNPDRSNCSCLKLTRSKGSLSYAEVLNWLFDHHYDGCHFQMDVYVPEGMCDSADFLQACPDHHDFWILRNVDEDYEEH